MNLLAVGRVGWDFCFLNHSVQIDCSPRPGAHVCFIQCPVPTMRSMPATSQVLDRCMWNDWFSFFSHQGLSVFGIWATLLLFSCLFYPALTKIRTILIQNDYEIYVRASQRVLMPSQSWGALLVHHLFPFWEVSCSDSRKDVCG